MPRNQLVFTVYHAKDGYRWRAKRGGRIVAESGEAYTRRSDAEQAVSRFCKALEHR